MMGGFKKKVAAAVQRWYAAAIKAIYQFGYDLYISTISNFQREIGFIQFLLEIKGSLANSICGIFV